MPAEEAKFSFSVLGDIAAITKRLAKLIWEHKKGLTLALILITVLVSAAPTLRSGSLALIINNLISHPSGAWSSRILLALTLFVAALVLIPTLRTLQFYLLRLFYFLLEEKFAVMILKKKGEIDMVIHEDPKYNDLFNKVKESGTWRIQQFTDRQFFILENAVEVVITAAVLAFATPLILIGVFLATIPELMVEAKYGRDVWNIYGAKAEVRRRYWNLHSHFDWLSDLTELKVFQNISHFLSIIKELLHSFHAEQKRIEKRKLILQAITFVISQTVIVFAIVWLIKQVLRGSMQVGTLTFFLAAITEFRLTLSNLFGNLGRHYQDGLFVKDTFALLDIQPVVTKPSQGFVIKNTPEIIFENVSFKYPGSEKPVLKNFSLTIRPGEKIALVGSNGAGKTTLVKLLARFYDPQKGRLLVGGHNLKEIDLESWYGQLGILFQDYSYYHFLAKEAIAMGRTSQKSALEKVKAAARASEADIFIEEWEKAYEQVLGKQFTGGIEPSIGQWQKLALARTFYRDPRILILDEPTSSIDAESEAKIFKKLERLPKDRTVILISHRFSTVRQANRIVVIKEGTIKELGTHKELLALDGLYARLFRLQAKGYQ